jgi:SHS2 domain-containing protein
VQVTAFGPNPDGEGLIFRLWEQAGNAGDVEVELPSSPRIESVQPVDLRGRPTGAPIPVKAGRFTTHIRAFAPASFVLKAQ